MVYIKISPVIWPFLVFLSLILHPALALSTTYYVNGNTGENTNDGTLATPWKTISYAVSMAFDQDTIYISPASYVESINLRPIPKRELLLIGLGADDNLPVIQSADPNTHTIDTTEFNGTLQGVAVTGATNANGINITEVGNADKFKDQTFIYDYSGNPHTIQLILNLMGYTQNILFHRSDPSSNADVVILLGADWIQDNTIPGPE